MKDKYPTAICKECGSMIFDGDGKVVKGGFWICTSCLIKIGKRRV